MVEFAAMGEFLCNKFRENHFLLRNRVKKLELIWARCSLESTTKYFREL